MKTGGSKGTEKTGKYQTHRFKNLRVSVVKFSSIKIHAHSHIYILGIYT